MNNPIPMMKRMTFVFIFLCAANSVISGKISIYAPYGMDLFSTYDRIKGVKMENTTVYFPHMTPSPNIFHI
jgi:hypothetical protein